MAADHDKRGQAQPGQARDRVRAGKIWKWVSIAFGSLLLMAVLGLIVLLLLFDWNWLKEPMAARASEATGRQVTIGGDITGELALVPRVRIPDLRIANADWADQSPDMLRVGSLELRIELLELLRGRWVFPTVDITQARIMLAKRKDGIANWVIDPDSNGDMRGDFPVIERLTIDDSRLDFHDPVRQIALSIKLASAAATGGAEQTVHVVGSGSYRQEDFEIEASGGPLLDLRAEGEPYPVSIELKFGDTVFKGRGATLRPVAFDGLDIDLSLQGDDLSDLFPLIGIPLPPTGAYSLRGALKRDDAIWSFRQFDGRVGDSDLRGDLRLDFSQKTPYMKAVFRSERLDFKDLGGFIGAPPNRPTPTRGDARIFPDMKLRLNRLRAMNMDVDFQGEKVIARRLPITNLESELHLENGVLTMQPLKFGVAGGQVSGPLRLDGSKEIPALDLDFQVKGLGLKPFLDKFDFGGLSKGIIGGKLALSGRGYSTAEILSTADGRITMAMVKGALDPMMVELIGLDIAEALLIKLSGARDPVPVRCLLSDMVLKNGTLETQGFVIDTADSNIWVDGTIQLESEQMSLRVRADPKDASLLSANAPIALSGPIKAPEVAIDTLGTEDEGGVVKAIGKVVNPILALLPFVDLGLAEDTSCRLDRLDEEQSQKSNLNEK